MEDAEFVVDKIYNYSKTDSSSSPVAGENISASSIHL